MRVAVLAAQGQLGTDVVKVLKKSGHEVMALGREVDILEPSQLAALSATHQTRSLTARRSPKWTTAKTKPVTRLMLTPWVHLT